MVDKYSRKTLESLTKKRLIEIAKEFGLKKIQNKRKNDIIDIILSFEDTSEKFVPQLMVNDINYEKIYHISDIHIRPLKRHSEYNEVFNELYSFLEYKDTNNIIAITGDILHEKDNLKPETVIIVRNFVKKLSEYGTVVIITGNHDMLENNSDRLDNLTAVLDDLPVYYLVKSGAYLFSNVILIVSSLVDKKFIRKTQVINQYSLPVISLYHGSISGSVTDIGYIIEDTSQHSTRFRKISDFDGFDIVLLGDIHKHQYLKPNIAYSGSLIQQNFGENLTEHGVLEWDIKTKKSIFYPIKNRYGFINIYINNKKWELPSNIPEKPYIRLLLRNTDNDYSEFVRTKLEEKFELQSFKTKQLTNECKESDLLPDEVTNHQDDIEILTEEMDIKKYDENHKENILDIHKTLKAECIDENLSYNMNNQNWKILKISFKNVFIFGENKTNVIDFTTLNGITTIVGPNAIGKSNIINIIIFLLYGSNINFKVSHILNKYQTEYFIECEIMFGAKKYKIRKTGKKRKGNKLNHFFSLYIFEDTWVKQDKENNKETTKIIKLLLGTVDQFLLTNVYSNSSLRTILTLTTSEKHKALSRLFCLDMYESLEKQAKKCISNIKKQYSYLEGEQKGLLYYFEDGDIDKIENEIQCLKEKTVSIKQELSNIEDNKEYIDVEIRNINDKKLKCQSQIKTLENIDFNKLKVELLKYESENSIVLSNESLDIENLKSNYYKLEGSVVKIDNIPEITDLDVYEKEKQKLESEYNTFVSSITSLQLKQDDFQNVLDNLNREIIDLPNEVPNDNTLVLNNLREKHYFNKEMNIDEAEQKLINLKSQLILFKPTKTPSKLPSDYNESLNKKITEETNNHILVNMSIINNISEEIKKIDDKMIDKNVIDKLDIESKDYDKKCYYDDQLNKLSKLIKPFLILPEIDNISDIKTVENEIIRINSNKEFITPNKIQVYIEKLASLENELGIVKVSVKQVQDFMFFLQKIKKTITSSTNTQYNNKLLKLISFKDSYYENIVITKHNKNITSKINSLKYWYYNFKISSTEKENIKLKNKLEVYNQNSYTYKYGLYVKCCELEDFIKYKKLLKEQNKYETFMENKQKNEKLKNERDKYEKELKEVKQNIINYRNQEKLLLNKIGTVTDNINLVCIYNNNQSTIAKMKELQKHIDEQLIRNSYKDLLNMCKKENEHISMIEKNEKMKNYIAKYDGMLTSLKKDLSNLTELYIKIKSDISACEKDILLKMNRLKELKNVKIKSNNINIQLDELKNDIQLYEDYICLVSKNNIPVKLIRKKNLYLQDHINEFLEKLTKFTISIDSDTNNGITFNAHKNGLILDVNQLSGYETFILNIALKSALNKYSFISKSTLFILDEGLDVVDKENFRKLDVLMKLLMRHYKHILLISHMPKVKDLQHHEVNIQNNGKSSCIS